MRVVLFVIMLVLSAVGPWVYLTAGSRAREARRDHLEQVIRDSEEVRRRIQQLQPPSDDQLDGSYGRLKDREAVLAGFGSRIMSSTQPVPDDATLRQLAADKGLESSLTDPILVEFGSAADADRRRRALHAIFQALDEAGSLRVEALHIGRDEARSDLELPVHLLRVAITAVGAPTELVGLQERLLAGSVRTPPADLVTAHWSRTKAGEWDRIGQVDSAPPVRLTLRADLLVAARSGR